MEFKKFNQFISEAIKVKTDIRSDYMDYHKGFVSALRKLRLNPVDIQASSDDMRGTGEGKITFVNKEGEIYDLQWEINQVTEDEEVNIDLDVFIMDSDEFELADENYEESLYASDVRNWITEQAMKTLMKTLKKGRVV